MALLETRRVSTSMSGWLGWLQTRPCLPHEETRVSWEARLEVTRPGEVRDEETQLDEQCEGEAGCTNKGEYQGEVGEEVS